MWHIELVKKNYNSSEAIYNLIQFVFRLDKTADDSKRANLITDDLTGCMPEMIPDVNDPERIFQLMLFTIQRRKKDSSELVRHRIISFQASDYILPQDLIPLAQSIAASYAAKGFITAYGIHADTYCVHIHFVICTISFITLNKLYSGYTVELEELERLTRNWNFQFNKMLQNDPEMKHRREAILYGDDIMQYGSIPLTTNGQISQNRKYKMEK